MTTKVPTRNVFKWGYVLALLLALASCNKFDNLDPEDFSLFGDEEEKEVTQLRRYSLPGMSQEPLVEFIKDPADSMSILYDSHFKKLCDYTKIPYRNQNISNWNTTNAIAPTTRFLSIVETKKLSQASINKLIEFVSNGGTLLLPFAGDDRRAAFLNGFKPEAEFETDVKSMGFFFSTPVLPNLKGKTYNEEVIHYGFTKDNFKKDVKILATAVNNPNFPLIVENPIGKGKVIYYNSTMTWEKIDRGLLFTAVLKGLEGIPYPVANTSTIFLDDFPSPLYDIKDEPVKSEMDLTVKDFVHNVWWPDMQHLADKYKIKYAAMIAFDYKNKVEPPFLFDQWDEHKIKSGRKNEVLSDWLVNDVAKKGHELAFHGYNHVSMRGKLWPNPDFIGTSLKAVEKKWVVSNFGALPETYVPPSNIIDGKGIDLLKKGMPSLKYMCSLYLGSRVEGGDREFDFDPYNKDFFDYPRVSDGFYMGTDKKYSHESLYLFSGIWTHFIHPDDIYQIASPFNKSAGDFDLRNERGLGWRKTKGKETGLYSEFDDYLQQMAKTYPQLRYVSGGEGGKIVNDWRASAFRHENAAGRYTVSEVNPQQSLSDTQYWFLYGSYKNAPKIDAQLTAEGAVFSKTVFQDGYLYSVYTVKPKLTLADLNFKTPAKKTEDAKIAKTVQQQYKSFLTKVKKYNSNSVETEWVDDSDKKFKLELESLKHKMFADTKIDSVTWNKYAKYLSWEERGLEVWKIYEDYCVKNPTAHNIMYSKELDRVIGYPNDLVREKWLSAQMLVTPNDVNLLNSYVASFYTPENQEKIRKALLNLLTVDTSFDTYLQYIQHLMTYDPEAARKELAEVKPAEKFEPAATDIAWLFADNNEYQKAYDWSAMSDDIDFATKMSWLIELRAYKPLEVEYKRYIVQNQDDYKTKAIMAGIYHELGRFKDAWVLANSLPESPEKEELRKTLNKDVEYVEPELQQDLLANHSELFYPEVLKQLTKTFRKEMGDFLAFDSSLESNKKDPSAFKNVLSYNFHDKYKNLHSVAATFSKMYRVEAKVFDPKDNITHTIFGAQYKFNNPKADEKLQYWASARAEYSDYDKMYFQFGMGANISKPKNYRSAEFRIFPAETGPAYSKSIYRMQLNLYQDYYFLKYLNGSLSLEGNYYTASKSTTPIRTGDTYEGSLTGKLLLDNGVEKSSKFLPFVEASYSQASLGKADIEGSYGYPYWILDNRFFAGGGLGWKFGKSDSNLIGRLEAGWFEDDYSSDFKRYVGEVNYQIFDYTVVTASLEIYSQSKFYSNVIQFGVKYNLKKRQKK